MALALLHRGTFSGPTLLGVGFRATHACIVDPTLESFHAFGFPIVRIEIRSERVVVLRLSQTEERKGDIVTHADEIVSRDDRPIFVRSDEPPEIRTVFECVGFRHVQETSGIEFHFRDDFHIS